MSAQQYETVFDLDTLLTDITKSFLNAANLLEDECSKPEWQERHAFDYSMPNLSASIVMELSHSDGKVKGVFRKNQTEKKQTVSSTIQLDLVAVPRASRPPS